MTVYSRVNRKKLQKKLAKDKNCFKHLKCAAFCIRPKALYVNLFSYNIQSHKTEVGMGLKDTIL